MGKKLEARRAKVKALYKMRREARCAFEEFKWAEYSGYAEGDEFMTKRYSSGTFFLADTLVFMFRIFALSAVVLYLGCMVPLICGDVANISGCAVLALIYSAFGAVCFLVSAVIKRKYYR